MNSSWFGFPLLGCSRSDSFVYSELRGESRGGAGQGCGPGTAVGGHRVGVCAPTAAPVCVALGGFLTLPAFLPILTNRHLPIYLLFRWTCLVASKGNGFGLAGAMKGDLGEERDHLQPRRAGLGLRSPGSGALSSQLAPCLFLLLPCVPPVLFPSLVSMANTCLPHGQL